LLWGCSSGGTYTVDQGRLADRFLPTERTVDHHPDSLRALAISEEDGKIVYQLDQDFASLTEKWSCSFRSVGTGRTPRSRTYATFWSLELSLVSLQPEMGILSLQKERAQELIEKRRKSYFDTIQIDVYWFVGQNQNGIITGPSARTRLRVGGNTYQTVRSEHGPLREAFVTGGDVSLYRRNTLYFSRVVDGTDILADASEMQLRVRRLGAGAEEEFTWNWETEETAARRPAEDVDQVGISVGSHAARTARP
jgi:hypothetical protein